MIVLFVLPINNYASNKNISRASVSLPVATRNYATDRCND